MSTENTALLVFFIVFISYIMYRIGCVIGKLRSDVAKNRHDLDLVKIDLENAEKIGNKFK